MFQWIIPLNGETPCSIADIGHKAWSLLRLRQFELPVPAAFCVSVAAGREHVRRAGLEPVVRDVVARLRMAKPSAPPPVQMLSDLRRRIQDAAPPGELASELAAALATLGAARVAVRSSALDEDMAAGSFAGLYDTCLNVRGAEDCLAAVRRCWASLWNERAWVYRVAMGLVGGEPGMGVIVQALVAADAAGVAFSADPRIGAAGQLVIEASYGLGESVVSGRVSPDRFTISKCDGRILEVAIGAKNVEVVPADRGVQRQPVPPSRAQRACLSEGTIRAVAALVGEVEKRLGAASDVEWAVAGQDVVLLQARPVTSSGVAPPDGQVWSNVNAGEVLPDVVSPLTWSLVGFVDGTIRRMLRRVGIDLGSHPLIGRIAGRVYFNLNTLAGVVRRIPGAGHQMLARTLGGLHQDADGAAVVQVADEDIPRINAEPWNLLFALPAVLAWWAKHQPQGAAGFVARLARRRRLTEAVVMSNLSDAQLAGRFESLVGLFRDDTLLAYSSVGSGYFVMLDAACRWWFRDAPAPVANGLVAGQGGVASAEAGLAMWALAAHAHQRTEVARVVAEAANFDELRCRLAATLAGQAFLQRWDDFMKQHGHHTRGEIELMTARWAEAPDYVLSLVRSYLEMLPQKDALAEYEARCDAGRVFAVDCRRRLRNPLKRALFDFLLRNARAGLAARENIKSEVVRHIALIRATALELGARLADRGVLARSDDVFLLDLHELVQAAHGPSRLKSPADGPRSARNRWSAKSPHRRTNKPSPFAADQTGDAASLAECVAGRRRDHIRNSRLAAPAVIGGVPAATAGGPGAAGGESWRSAAEVPARPMVVMRGLPVSPGRARGRARVILMADGGQTLLPGEVLIAPFTDPGWTPYFLPAAAIVMDMGGVLSHGSIVAREYGIPAVVNVGPATRLIATGQVVEVDGDRGEVRIVDSA